MSPTVRRTVIACRAGVAGAATAVLLLAACGDDGGNGAGSSPTEGAGQGEATETSGGDDFCTQAAGLEERVDSALSDLEGEDPSVPDAFRQIARELRAIDAPDPIASDWDAMAGGLDRMANAFADFDITDPDSVGALEDVEGELSTASTNVENYLRDECGIDP
jgi:hypothetical protein